MLPVEQLAKQIASEGFMPQILEMERRMDANNGREVAKAIDMQHLFLKDGVYLRYVTLPKGQIVAGMFHKQEHFLILAKGSIQVITAKSKEVFTAPCVTKGFPGMKRMLMALEDCVAINVFGTPCTDVDELDDTLGCISPEDFANFILSESNKC